MRCEILSDRLTLGRPGDVVDIDPKAVNVRALIKGGHVKPAPKPKPVKKSTRKAAD